MSQARQRASNEHLPDRTLPNVFGGDATMVPAAEAGINVHQMRTQTASFCAAHSIDSPLIHQIRPNLLRFAKLMNLITAK